MIRQFVELFESKRSEIEEQFKAIHPESYEDVVRIVVAALSVEEEYGLPDPNRIHLIDDGDYQGTLLFVVGARGYQPSRYWGVKVGYGSCSGCDTLLSIKSDGGYDERPNEGQVKDYMTLALHVVQGLCEIGGIEAV